MKNILTISAILWVFCMRLTAQTPDSTTLAGMSLSRLDSLYKLQKTPQEQLPYALAMLKKGTQELDTKDTAYAKLLYRVGDAYQKMRELSKATDLLQQAVDIQALKIPKSMDYTNSLYALGTAYRLKNRPEEAEKHYLQVKQIYEETIGRKNVDYAHILNNLGILYRAWKKYAQAEAAYLKTLEIRKEVLGEKSADYGGTLVNLGTLCTDWGKFEKAEAYLFEAKKVFETSNLSTHLFYMNCLTNIGRLYYQSDRFFEAEKFYKEVLELKKKVYGEEHQQYADGVSYLSTLYIAMGKYTEAESLALQYLAIRKRMSLEGDLNYAITLVQLGMLYTLSGNYSKVEAPYLEAKEMYKTIYGNQDPNYAGILVNLGLLYTDLGNYEKAESYFLEAQAIFENQQLTQHPFYANCLNNLGNLYCKMGDYDKGEKMYLQTLDIRKQFLGEKNLDYATNLQNLGVLNLYRKNYLRSDSFHLRALDIKKEILGEAHPEYAMGLNERAVLLRSSGDYSKAEALYLQSLEIWKKTLHEKHYYYVSGLYNLGLLYSDMQNYGKADSLYRVVIDAKNFDIQQNFTWLNEKGRAAFWQKEKDFYGYLNAFAAMTAEKMPQSAGLAYNANLVAKSLLLESSRAVEEAAENSRDSSIAELYKNLKEKRRLILHLRSSNPEAQEMLRRYEWEVDSLDHILLSRLGEYAASKRRFQTDWKEVQAALKADEAAIEFARYFDAQDSSYRYLALLLRPGYEYPKLVKLCAEKELEVIPAGKGFAELDRLVWQPIDSFLSGVKTVMYTPDGLLNNLSFCAFCGQGKEIELISKDKKNRGKIKTSTTKIENCNYLADRYTLHQLSTTRYLSDGLKTVPISGTALVFGGVNYDEIAALGDSLPRAVPEQSDILASRSSSNALRMEYLPGTAEELKSIEKLLARRDWQIRSFSGQEASENNLKKASATEPVALLHIATHGFAFALPPDKNKSLGDENKAFSDADNPMARCGLLLAGANHSWTGNQDTMLTLTGEDGILTALEVSGLPLRNTKLVVLSACETGLGKIEGAEGTFGLKRGFKLAGVEQIIVSLWSVPDKETMELMNVFYSDLAKTENAVLSFEKAQREMRKKYPKRPDLWAGFVLLR